MGNANKAIAYIREGFYTLYSIANGHLVTLVNLFKPKVTLMYPEVKWELPDGYRGMPCLPVDPDTGKDLCIGCGACARVCPTQVITVETHTGEDKKKVVDEFSINMGRCTFCGLCTEMCPVNAIVMGTSYELAAFTREGTRYTRVQLNEIGGMREPKPKEVETGGEDA